MGFLQNEMGTAAGHPSRMLASPYATTAFSAGTGVIYV
jgi:hypothetical protein